MKNQYKQQPSHTDTGKYMQLFCVKPKRRAVVEGVELTLLHLELQILHRVLAVLSAVGLNALTNQCC